MWQLYQLEQLFQEEPDLVTRGISKLLASEDELREKLVIGAYQDNQINLSKAAEMLDLHPVELRRQFLAKGISIKMGIESREEIMAEKISAQEIWNDAK